MALAPKKTGVFFPERKNEEVRNEEEDYEMWRMRRKEGDKDGDGGGALGSFS